MRGRVLPTIRVRLRPSFADNGDAISLGFSMTIRLPSLNTNEALCFLPIEFGEGTTQRYAADRLHVSDDNGQIHITACDESINNILMRSYHVKRPTAADFEINFDAYPVKVDQKTRIGGRYELRKDQGGLQGMGLSTIAIPWDGSMTTKAKYQMHIAWDLSKAPSGTRAVSSFGEGHVRRIGPSFELWRMVFAAGPLKSYPPSSDAPKNSYFGVYWLGEPPESITALPPLCESLFKHISGFFFDKPSEKNPYRIFVRRATPARGFGGSGGVRSFVLEYDDAIDTIRQDEIFYLLAHEMVHNWPLMDGSPKGENEDLVARYNEGVADYYASVLPYRLGIRSKLDSVKRMNSKMSQYYTNLCRCVSNREAQDKAWTSPNLQTLSYTRGMLYLFSLDTEIKHATHGRRPVDDIVLRLLEDLRKGRAYGVAEWKEMLVNLLGEGGLEHFESMNEGKIIKLPTNAFGPEI